ncbi:MAG: hypothetical protein ACLTYN_10275 [Dysosmobacter welbionis]
MIGKQPAGDRGAPRLPQGRLLRRTDGPGRGGSAGVQPAGGTAAGQWAQIDLTGSGIYNISETSQDYLAGLEDDVVIHVLTDKDTLDTRIVRFRTSTQISATT